MEHSNLPLASRQSDIVFRGSRLRSDWGGYEIVVTGVQQYQGWSNLRTLRLVILHSNQYNFTGAKASV